MDPQLQINNIGHYCGRYTEGFLGEPQNSFSNIIFIVGDIYAWHIWRKNGSKDILPLFLFGLVAVIGFGSFTFQSFPSEKTIMVDLIPIQIFSLAYFGYIGSRYFGASAIFCC